MKIPIKGRLYKCHGSSTYIRVLNVYYHSDTKIACKLQFEYKNGMPIEKKSYKLQLDKIQHWEKVNV